MFVLTKNDIYTFIFIVNVPILSFLWDKPILWKDQQIRTNLISFCLQPPAS